MDFDDVLIEAKKDDNILGLFLLGSRGKGFHREDSDYDIMVIVNDGFENQYKKKYPSIWNKMEFTILCISEFKNYADFGGNEHWARYDFYHAKALIDKTKTIQKLINEKGIIPKEFIKQYSSGMLDGYINHVKRSLECFRKGNISGARLEAANSVNFFFDAIFGFEGRMKPYPQYIEIELKKYPLKYLGIKPNIIINHALKILENADIKSQKILFKIIIKFSKKLGYFKVLDSWDKRGELQWIKKRMDIQ